MLITRSPKWSSSQERAIIDALAGVRSSWDHMVSVLRTVSSAIITLAPLGGGGKGPPVVFRK